MKLNENIAALRRERGLSQEKLAEELGVSRQAISKWESGGALPELERLTQMSQLFGVSLDQLMGTSKQPSQGDPQEQGESVQNAPAPRQSKAGGVLLWCLAGAGCLAAVMGLVLGQIQLRTLERRLEGLQSQILSLEQNQPMVWPDTTQGPEPWLSKSSAKTKSYDAKNQLLQIEAQATPQELPAGARGEFTFAGQDQEAITVAGQAVGAAGFTAQAQVPLCNGVEVSFNLILADGTVRSQLIETLWEPAAEFVGITGGRFKGRQSQNAQGLVLDGAVDVELGSRIRIVALDIEIWADGKLVDTMEGARVSEAAPAEGPEAPQEALISTSHLLKQNIPAQSWVELRAVGRDEEGMTHNATLARWVKSGDDKFTQEAPAIRAQP